ncbi:hypothetical protein PV327_005211 [Microctonus hyperodae]|uniref:Structural maintenance of chromosomes protein n=1 Tax=Microctonus hyperodae TaxID=165561 RepID=A0AA39G0W8_MICHY|nr:hypothetical protein PV327_005211 [Microctonus hyperodae]
MSNKKYIQSSNDQVEPMEINGHIDSDEGGGLRIDDIYIPPPPNTFNNNDNPKRLIIKKIVNINFKSYAGEVVIGPFHKCFSAIVGPNGSGKSNIIDSMLFVFGYRANKMRFNKISGLIHSSSQHPNIECCTVSIYFEKILDKLINNETVSEDQIIISKTALKNNKSFYELNGKRVQFKEIAKFLRNEAVDLDYNRFLILQGEVEQIAMMKPKAQNENDIGLLEFLEDIIGTSRYKEPLEKLMEKIDVITETLNEKFNRLRIVESERDQLKAPMDEAVKYIKIENKKIKLQYKLYCCKKYRNIVNINKINEQQKELCEDGQKLEEELKNINTEKKLKNEKMNEQCEKWKKIQDEFDVARAKFDEIKKRDDALHAELVETNKRRKSNIESMKIEKKTLDQLQSVPKKNEELIEEYEKLIKKTTASLKKEEAKLKPLMDDLNKQTEPFIKQRCKYERELISHREKIDKAQADFDVAESAFNLYTSVEKTEKKKLNELQETLNTSVQTIKNHNEKLSLLKIKIPATEQTLSETEKKLEKLKAAEIEINNQLKKTRQQVEVQRCAMHTNRSRNKVIDALMEEKTKGRIPGIFGRLGDLGAIDSKYDVAISTACGPLDNVVVDTVDTAQTCIQFLRDNGIGRSTFIALEKMKRFLPQCQRRIQTPENVSRLFDLIQVKDKRVLPAFYYGLHDTLVANNLNQATRIAYGTKRHRVVTLKGELIETSGTMSGGGNTISRGRMGQSVVERQSLSVDITVLEKSLETTYAECDRLKLEIKPLEDQIVILSSQLKDMRIDRDKYMIQLKRLSENLLLLKSQLKIQEKKVASSVSNPVKVKELDEAVQNAKKLLDKVSQESEVIEIKVSEINRKIEELSVDHIKEQQEKIMNLNQTIDEAKGKICKLEIEVKTAERNLQKTEQRILTLECGINNCKKRIHDIQGEKRECEIEGKVLLEVSEKCGEELMKKKDVLSSLKAEYDKSQKTETKLKALKIDLDQKLKENEKLIHDLNKKIKEYKVKINSLQLNPLPGENPQELIELTENEIELLDIKTLTANLASIKEHLSSEIPNMQIIEEYQQKDILFIQRSDEIGVITEAKNKLRSAYDMAKRRRQEEFFTGFSEITSKLKEMYQMITLGGAAELELVDSLDPFTEGIVFSVRPPKKSWKNISNLSGGEKTLSSLALVFALHHYKPTPLYFMDEIDAALDFKNVSIVGTYIKEQTKNAQFIVISLRSEMFELADTLVGIYKTHNTTKTTTINLQNMYIENPALAAREKERQERFRCRKISTQIGRQYATMSQPIASTCPARINSLIPNKKLTIDTVCMNTNVSINKKHDQKFQKRKRSSSNTDSLQTTNELTQINCYKNRKEKKRKM